MEKVYMRKETLIPQGIEVKAEKGQITVKGPAGELKKPYREDAVAIETKEGKAVVASKNETRRFKALAGTYRAHIANMVSGVSGGYEARLKIVHSHFPIKVKAEKDRLVIENFLGEKESKSVATVGRVEIKVEKDEIIVTGIDREEVGLAAARIERATRIRGFDRRVFQDGIYLTQRAIPRAQVK